MERRLGVFLVADLVDYTRLMDEDQSAAIEAVRALKDRFLEPKVAEHGGEILKRMGDGWIVSFSSVTPALDCAMSIQQSLVGHGTIRLRIGAHIGEVVFEAGDFYGAGVNLAQRLQTEAPPGGLMISQDLFRQLDGALSKQFSDAGSFRLKNIALPVTGYQWRPKRGGSAVSDVPTIAVEAFPCAPDDGETRAAAADLRDQLLLHLSRRTGIRVLDEATGRSEDSHYILRGRLRTAQGRGRFNLALILRSEGRTVWSQSYEGDTADIFSFCDDLVQRANVDLRLQVNMFDGERVADLPDEELSLSELRSRAATNFYKASIEGHERSLSLTERALRLNPDDPMALAMHAEAVFMLAAARHEVLGEEIKGRLADDLDRAIEAMPRSDYIFSIRALHRAIVMRDANGAVKDAERALSLSPSYAVGYEALGITWLVAGQFEKAVETLQRAVELSEADPLQHYRRFFLSLALLCNGAPEEAAREIELALHTRPKEWAFHRLHALCLRRAGDEAGAEKAEALAAGVTKGPSLLAPHVPLPNGRQEEILEALRPN